MARFKFKTGSAKSYSDEQDAGLITSAEALEFDADAKRPHLQGLDDTVAMLHLADHDPNSGWVAVADLEPVAVVLPVVEAESKTGGLILFAVGALALVWGIDRVMSRPASAPASTAYANRHNKRRAR